MHHKETPKQNRVYMTINYRMFSVLDGSVAVLRVFVCLRNNIWWQTVAYSNRAPATANDRSPTVEHCQWRTSS